MPPRDAVELQQTQSWEKSLKFPPIGVADGFFAIEGDSLAAVNLMLMVEREFPCRLPIMALIQETTISAIAN